MTLWVFRPMYMPNVDKKLHDDTINSANLM